MMIEGRILEIMESHPPELIVESEGETIFVGLRPEARLTRNETPVGYGHLKPGQKVAVEGSASADNAMIANELTLLD